MLFFLGAISEQHDQAMTTIAGAFLEVFLFRLLTNQNLF